MRIKKILVISSLIMWVIFIWLGSINIESNILSKEHCKDLTNRIMIVEDTNNSFDVRAIIEQPDNIYIPFASSSYVSKLSEANYWFKLELDQVDKQQVIEISKPQLAKIEFYQVNNEGNIIREEIQGRDYPFESRELKHRSFIFRLIPSDMPTSIYLKVKTDTYLQMPITLWQDTEFFNYATYSNMLHGLFYGMILIMLLYNLILGISLKDMNYYVYVCLGVSYLFLQLVWDGFTYQYLWPNSPKWDLIANPIFMLCISLSMLVFTYRFLKLHQYKSLKGLFIGLVGLNVFSFGCVLFLPVNVLIYISMILASLVMIYCLSGLVFKKLSETEDIIYLIAVELLFISYILNILAGLGILPYTIITAYATKVGVIALFLLFSIALSSRIKNIEYLRGIEVEKRQLLKGLHDMNKKITVSRDLNEIAEHLISHFVNMTKYKDGLLVLVDPSNNSDVRAYKSCALDWSIKLNDKDLDHMQSYINISKISYCKGYEFDYLMIDPEVKNVMIIPLISYGVSKGAIILYTNQMPVHDLNIEDVLLDYANQITLNIGNVKLLDEITKTARTDDLTQIHNRRYIFELASQYYRQNYIKKSFTVMMLDIDHFKKINDDYGHVVGDQLMEQVAQHIKAIIKGKGEIGRYGGDEFMIIVPNMTHEHVSELAKSICISINKMYFKIDNHKVQSLKVSVSIGVAHREDSSDSIYLLCERGDKALYTAKKNGRNQIAIYNGLDNKYNVV